MKLLLNKRVDIAILNLYTGYKIARDTWSAADAKNLTHNQKPIRLSKYYITFDRNQAVNKENRRLFNQGLRSLRKDGTYDVLKANLLLGLYDQ